MGNIIMKKKISIDFNNTAIAFSGKTDKQLKKMTRLFQLMNQSWLVNIGSKIGVAALNLNLPFVEATIKHTIFEQFCGGTTLLDSQPTINELSDRQTLTILDYGAEAKISELDFNGTMNEMIRAIDFAEQNKSVPVISMKITGISRFTLLEKIQNGEALTEAEKIEFKNVNKRLDAICYAAHHKKIAVFVDAEESWIQDTIDFLVKKVMKRYNKEQVIVYNTFQMYRHDRLQYLIDSYEEARKEGYLLGAKLVRGAYMEKERARAATLGKPSPIQPSKEATDNDYNTAIQFCVEHYTHIGSCNATHNTNSCILLASLIDQKNIKKDHPHLNFCQLYGMSDHITFNLADGGYNVAKYVPYGPVQDVVPYLIRRAQENSAISGDMNREYKLIVREMKRRGLK